jgi:hypothetical protein
MFKQILFRLGYRSRNSGTTEKSRNLRTIGATRLILAFAGIAGALTAVLLLFPRGMRPSTSHTVCILFEH